MRVLVEYEVSRILNAFQHFGDIYLDTIVKALSKEGFSTAISLQFSNIELLSLILG